MPSEHTWDMILPLHYVAVTCMFPSCDLNLAFSVDFQASKNLHVDYL